MTDETFSLPDAALGHLRALLGARVSTGPSERATHGRDESWHAPCLPDAVAFPETTAEVAAIARICHAHRVPMIPFGIGSSVEGAVIPVAGGVALDMTRMNRVRAVNAPDFDCVVEPGVQRRALNEYLRDTGLFFSVDPGADATIGGMTATRASGTNAVRYGTMADVVRGLEVVLADGRVIRTGGRARKSSAGYDLTRLFVGSEGTLGIVTEITLRLSPIPEAVTAAVCAFDSLEGAVAASTDMMRAGLPVARLELLDEVAIAAVNAYSQLGLPEAAHLFLEFHGTPEGAETAARDAEEIARDNGATGFARAVEAEARNRLWRARHDAAYAAMAFRPGSRLMTTDVCVPLSALAECILSSRADAAAAGIVAPVVGHVGDGNFHMALLIDPARADEVKAAEGVSTRLVARALEAGGTSTGEHGVGLGKRGYMRDEHGEAVEVMRALKAALDPLGLMNPGKVLPDPA